MSSRPQPNKPFDRGALPLAVARLAMAASFSLAPGAAAAADAQISVVRVAAMPTSATDAVWRDVTPAVVKLIPQDMVEPRQLQTTTPEVSVRACTNGAEVAFLLEWEDATVDDAIKPAQFSDACAVQLPADVAADVPAPQMGEPGRPVEVAYWRAAWQAAAHGRPDDVRALYPGAAIDHYPFEAPSLEPGSPAQEKMAERYAPARAAGNEMAAMAGRTVQDLIAEGPGTLSPAPAQQSRGAGARSATGWTVMLVRPTPAGLTPGRRTQVAFAVWNGALDEVGARKMRSVWIPIAVEKGR